MKKVFVITFVFVNLFVFGQVGIELNQAKRQGLINLDSIYRSAIHSDSTQAVFTTQIEKEQMIQAYTQMLEDFGKFLSGNNFEWKKKTQGFNRVYFNEQGKVDYFLFSFTKSENAPTQEEQDEFQRLLNLFIKDYQLGMSANTKFSQCNPVTFLPKEQ